MRKFFLQVFCICLSISLLPLFVGNADFDHKEKLEQVLTSPTATIFFSCSIAVAFPLLVDLCLDVLLRPISEYTPERIVLLIAIILPACLLFSLSASSNIVMIYHMVTCTQSLLISFALFSLMALSESTIWKKFECRTIYVLYCIYQLSMLLHGYKYKVANTFLYLGVVVYFIGLLYFSVLLVRYSRYLYKRVRDKSLSSSECIPMIYSLCMLIYAFTDTAIAFALLRKNVNIIFFLSTMTSIIASISTILPGRMVQFEVIETRKLLEVKRTFIRYISHEMRTPMNVCMVGLDLIINNVSQLRLFGSDYRSLIEETDEILQQVRDGISTAVHILDDILTYDKLYAKLMILDRSMCFISEMVLSTMRMFELQAKKAFINFSTTINLPPTLQIFIDKFKINQVLRNIASNAMKFTPSGGFIHVNVSVVDEQSNEVVFDQNTIEYHLQNNTNSNSHGTAPENSAANIVGNIAGIADSRANLNDSSTPVLAPAATATTATTATTAVSMSNSGIIFPNRGVKYFLRIQISDNGAGISPQNIPKLFRQIIQFDANRLQNGKGTGLGLYISREIIELHNGRIFVESQGEGFGSKFTILLPFMKPSTRRSHSNNIPLNINQNLSASGSAGGAGTPIAGTGNAIQNHNKRIRSSSIQIAPTGNSNLANNNINNNNSSSSSSSSSSSFWRICGLSCERFGVFSRLSKLCCSYTLSCMSWSSCRWCFRCNSFSQLSSLVLGCLFGNEDLQSSSRSELSYAISPPETAGINNNINLNLSHSNSNIDNFYVNNNYSNGANYKSSSPKSFNQNQLMQQQEQEQQLQLSSFHSIDRIVHPSLPVSPTNQSTAPSIAAGGGGTSAANSTSSSQKGFNSFGTSTIAFTGGGGGGSATPFDYSISPRIYLPATSKSNQSSSSRPILSLQHHQHQQHQHSYNKMILDKSIDQQDNLPDSAQTINHNLNNSRSTNNRFDGVDSSTIPLKGKRILVVDDSPANIKIVVMLLRKFGAVCDEATNGKEALRAVESSLQFGLDANKQTEDIESQSQEGQSQLQGKLTNLRTYDFIFMDNLMPIMNGPEAAKMMRLKGFTGPIIGLTGQALESDIKEYLNCGANKVLIKPLNRESLREAICFFS